MIKKLPEVDFSPTQFSIQGGNILALQKILGHANLVMTMRYAHLSPERLQEAVQLNPLAPLTVC